MQTDNLELKKLVYLYLMNYAKSQPDMAIMAVNTFVKVSRNPVEVGTGHSHVPVFLECLALRLNCRLTGLLRLRAFSSSRGLPLQNHRPKDYASFIPCEVAPGLLASHSLCWAVLPCAYCQQTSASIQEQLCSLSIRLLSVFSVTR